MFCLHWETFSCRCCSFSVHKKIRFGQIFFCCGPKNSGISKIFEPWGAIAPAPPAGTTMVINANDLNKQSSARAIYL